MRNIKKNIKKRDVMVLSYVIFVIVAVFLSAFIIYKISQLELMEVGELHIKKIEETVVEDDDSNILLKEYYIKMRQDEIDNLGFVTDEMIKFIKYKGICVRYQDSTGIKEDVTEYLHSNFSLDEIYLMQRVIETECYQRDFRSKVNVASVILNRLENGKFGNNIEEIITNKNQFAYGRRYITYDTILALEYASYYGDTTNGALYFHSNEKTDRFSGKSHIFTDDSGHYFYG